jgi:hypothetical protein
VGCLSASSVVIATKTQQMTVRALSVTMMIFFPFLSKKLAHIFPRFNRSLQQISPKSVKLFQRQSDTTVELVIFVLHVSKIVLKYLLPCFGSEKNILSDQIINLNLSRINLITHTEFNKNLSSPLGGV